MRYKSIGAFVIVGVLSLLTACSSDSDGGGDFRVFDASERTQIEEQKEISEYRTHDYNSVVEAFVLGSYRAVGVQDQREQDYPENSTTGLVLFAQCDKGKTFEDCAKSIPTIKKPHAYTQGQWYMAEDGPTVSISGEIHWRAKVGQDTLDCVADSFQLNPYSIAQIPEALGKFVQNGKPRTGNLEVEFPPNPDPKGDYSMGQGPYDIEPVLWTCSIA